MQRAGMLAVLILGVVIAAGCGDDEVALGGVGAACNTVNDCATEPLELFCTPVGAGATFTKMCTRSCNGAQGDAECAMFGNGVECVDDEGKCMYTCANGSRCPNGGMCVNPGKCFP